LLKPLPDFQPTFKRVDLFRLHVPRAGVSYAPELEWRLAARWAGYRYIEEFTALDGEEQSAIVATYRIDAYLAAVLTQEQMRESKRKGRKR
jgi:hypothetical protein